MNVFSYCDKDRPDPDTMQGWWLKNYIPILCSVCQQTQAGWVYVGEDKNHSQQ